MRTAPDTLDNPALRQVLPERDGCPCGQCRAKIDASFASDVTGAAEYRTVTGAVMPMAGAPGLELPGDWGDGTARLGLLRRQGSGAVQACLCNRPLPARAFAEFVRTRALAGVH